MSKFSNRAFAATIALCLISGVASAEEMHISYKGLDLARPADAAIFSARIERTAQQFCDAYVGDFKDMGARTTCQQAIVEEAEARLPDRQRAAFARSRQATPEIVSAQR